MHSPVFAALKKLYPNCTITVWVAPRGTKALAKNDPNVDRVIVAPIRRSIFLQAHHVFRLSRRKFDTAIMLSPGQQWKGAASMFLAGIGNRLAHNYPHLGHDSSHFLLTDALPEQDNLHDIEQNLNLLTLLNPNYKIPTTNYNLSISGKAASKANSLIKQLKIADHQTIIGIHPGSAQSFRWKRWPIDRFAKLCRQLIKHQGAHILIFGGPDEMALKKELRSTIGQAKASIISADLLTTAGVMQHCKYFISNDSGLMHLAAAAGVKTFGLFGPTDEKKTGPRGPASNVIRSTGTKAVYDTEHNFDLGEDTHSTLKDLSVNQVLTRITPAPSHPEAD